MKRLVGRASVPAERLAGRDARPTNSLFSEKLNKGGQCPPYRKTFQDSRS